MNNSTIVFESSSRKRCLESQLVLESAGLPSRLSHQDSFWVLIVDIADAEAALEELRDYESDRVAARVDAIPAADTFAFSGTAMVIYAGIVVLFGVVTATEESSELWVNAGGMEAGKVCSGHIWRTLTALTLHADAGHLLSNLVFGCFFGLLTGRILGGGVAWMMIVLAGAMGNGVNAMVRPPDYVSIGASTAVFAAIGIMVAHALRPSLLRAGNKMRRYSPLISGLVLLSLIGLDGERTDVGAHFAGFATGILFGALACRLPAHWLAKDSTQAAAGFFAIGLIFAAWGAATAMLPR